MNFAAEIQISETHISKKCSEGITNKKELNKQFFNLPRKAGKDCKTSLARELDGKSFAQHTKEYNALCRKAIGSEDAEQMAANYIENAKNMQPTLKSE